MKRKDILDALNDIDFDMIEDAEGQHQRTHNTVWLRWAAVAACLCLVIGVAVVLPIALRHGNDRWLDIPDETTEDENGYDGTDSSEDETMSSETTFEDTTGVDINDEDSDNELSTGNNSGANSNPEKYTDGLVFELNDDKASYAVVKYEGTASKVEIPSIFKGKSVTVIADEAFRNCKNITDITIPDSIINIKYASFYGCENLTSVEIPNSVTRIGGWAFFQCEKLESIVLGDSVKTIGTYAFGYCSALANINFGDSTPDIGEESFRDCSSLVTVTIPDGVVSIGKAAFYNCASLENIVVPDSVAFIGDAAFGATKIKTATVPAIVLPQVSSMYLQTVVISSGNKIPDMSLANGKNLTSVTIPDSVKSIGSHAFSGCTALTNINIPGSVTSIGKYAFYNVNVEYLTIPDSVTQIDENAFSSCANLKSVLIGKGVANIGQHAFYQCTALTDITVMSESVNIDRTALSGCSSLKTAALPAQALSVIDYYMPIQTVVINGGTSIHLLELSDFETLESIEISSSVTTIEELALCDCVNLNSIKFNGTKSQWNAITFGKKWNSGVPATKVICSDGEIALSQTK